MKQLLKAYLLLDAQDRWQAWLVVVIVVVTALFDTLGTVSIMPFLAVLANPDLISKNRTLASVHDALGFTGSENFLMFLGLASFALLIVSAIVRSLGQFLVNRFTQMRTYRIGERLLETYLRQPYAFFLNRHSGDIGKQLLSDIDVLVAQIYQPAANLIAQAVLLSVLMVLLVVVNPLVALIGLLVLAGSYGTLYLLIRSFLSRAGQTRSASIQERFRTVSEALGGIKIVKLVGRESYYHKRFAVASRESGRLQAITTSVSLVPRYAVEALAFGGIILLTLALMVKYRDHEAGALSQVLPLLGFYTFAGYRILPTMQGIYQALSQLRFGSAVLDTITIDLANSDALPRLPMTPAVPIPFTREIEIRQLGFTYPNAQAAALTDLSLTIPIGSTLGIVGSTGSGKTTLVDLFLGLLTPGHGAVVVDGIAVTPSTVRAWQADLGYVPQDIFLSDASVTKNIALGLPQEEIDILRVRQAARMAQILDFVETQMPEGFETKVGERGVRLSGGQRQRIGIARALYNNPGIIIFDEATSALDTLTEQEVVKAINGLAGTKTILIIAHRISTVQNCDQILVLEQGRMVGLGQYDDLYRNNAAFRRLVDVRGRE